MARSHSIYVVISGAIPLAAFTVKHEALTYLANFDDLDGVQVHVFRDGLGPDLRKAWGAATFLAKRGKE